MALAVVDSTSCPWDEAPAVIMVTARGVVGVLNCASSAGWNSMILFIVIMGTVLFVVVTKIERCVRRRTNVLSRWWWYARRRCFSNASVVDNNHFYHLHQSVSAGGVQEELVLQGMNVVVGLSPTMNVTIRERLSFATTTTTTLQNNNKNNRQQQEQMLLTSEQIETIRSQRWKDVLAWIVFSHPEELLRRVDKHQQTILHHLCLFRAPAHVIAMALYQAPELACMANIDNEIPLHWAIRLSAPNEVIECLVQAALSSACDIADKDGNTALSMVWERHDDDLWWWSSSLQQERGVVQQLPSSTTTPPSWKRILYFLQCYARSASQEQSGNDRGHGSMIDDEDGYKEHSELFRPLHVATQCAMCPSTLYLFLLRVYHDQICDMDDMGRTPLAVACANPQSNRSLEASTKVYLLLGGANPPTTISDNSGRIPLFTALESGIQWDEGVDRLIALNPKSLLQRDPVTFLPAFLLAATGSTQQQHDGCANENEAPTVMGCSTHPNRASVTTTSIIPNETRSLTTIFSLLRADPAQLCCLIQAPE